MLFGSVLCRVVVAFVHGFKMLRDELNYGVICMWH